MKKLIIDVASGTRQEVDLSAEEIAELESRQAEIEAEAQAKVDARQSAIAKLEALGLTMDEVSAAFGIEVQA